MLTTTNNNQQSAASKPKNLFSVAAGRGRLARLTITEEQVEAAHVATFGARDDAKLSGASIMAYVDSPWVRANDKFYRQRIVHVRNNNTLLLRFAYDYEVDLDRITTERELLAWVLHLVGKPWMGPERTKMFAKAVAEIKGFDIEL
jgi:hypothetical protein